MYLVITYVLLFFIDLFTKRFNQKAFKSTKNQIAYELGVLALVILFVNNTLGLALIMSLDDGLQAHDPIILNVVVLAYSLLLFVYKRANYYLNAISDQKIKIEKLAREKVETELKFLKAQINPHFLFNAINNIYHLIEEDKERAQEMLDELSQMLRYQLYECNRGF